MGISSARRVVLALGMVLATVIVADTFVSADEKHQKGDPLDPNIYAEESPFTIPDAGYFIPKEAGIPDAAAKYQLTQLGLPVDIAMRLDKFCPSLRGGLRLILTSNDRIIITYDPQKLHRSPIDIKKLLTNALSPKWIVLDPTIRNEKNWKANY